MDLQTSLNNSTKHKSDAFRNVVTFSKHGFTAYEYKVLGYNPNFFPTSEH